MVALGLCALSFAGLLWLPELEARALVLIAQGKDSATIARELNVARGTVSSYRMRGYRALGIRSRVELAALLASGISS